VEASETNSSVIDVTVTPRADAVFTINARRSTAAPVVAAVLVVQQALPSTQRPNCLHCPNHPCLVMVLQLPSSWPHIEISFSIRPRVLLLPLRLIATVMASTVDCVQSDITELH